MMTATKLVDAAIQSASCQDMKRALIIGSSGGIGSAILSELKSRSFEVKGLSRSHEHLDVTDEESVRRNLNALEPDFDVVFVGTGILEANGRSPEKSLRQLDPEALTEAFRVNAMGPAIVLKHCVRLLPKARRSVVAILSARVGSIEDNKLGGWHGYRASKAALNQIVRGASIELGRSHPKAIVVALHPGTVSTRFTENYTARHKSVTPRDAARNLSDVIENLKPHQSGTFLDYAGKPVPW